MVRTQRAVRGFAGTTILAVGLFTATISVSAGATSAPAGDSVRAQTSAADRVQGNVSGANCVSFQEFRRLDANGKRGSSLRQVRRIIGYNGERESLSRAVGSRWEIRKYLRCNSEILHVYVNYRDNRSYRKSW